MTWKELKDKISLMTEEEQQQEVAVWGEYLNFPLQQEPINKISNNLGSFLRMGILFLK